MAKISPTQARSPQAHTNRAASAAGRAGRCFPRSNAASSSIMPRNSPKTPVRTGIPSAERLRPAMESTPPPERLDPTTEIPSSACRIAPPANRNAARAGSAWRDMSVATGGITIAAIMTNTAKKKTAIVNPMRRRRASLTIPNRCLPFGLFLIAPKNLPANAPRSPSTLPMTPIPVLRTRTTATFMWIIVGQRRPAGDADWHPVAQEGDRAPGRTLPPGPGGHNESSRAPGPSAHFPRTRRTPGASTLRTQPLERDARQDDAANPARRPPIINEVSPGYASLHLGLVNPVRATSSAPGTVARSQVRSLLGAALM